MRFHVFGLVLFKSKQTFWGKREEKKKTEVVKIQRGIGPKPLIEFLLYYFNLVCLAWNIHRLTANIWYSYKLFSWHRFKGVVPLKIEILSIFYLPLSRRRLGRHFQIHITVLEFHRKKERKYHILLVSRQKCSKDSKVLFVFKQQR